MRFVLSLAWREARGSKRRGLLIVVAVAIGVAALVAINSFTANLRDSVQREARGLLGADLSIGSAGPWNEKAESLVAELRRATRPEAELSRVVSFGAMVYRPGGETTRLAQVLAVDPGYPYYGKIETDPAAEWARLGEAGGAIVDPSLLTMLGAEVGSEIALGEARFVVRATIVEAPGEVSLRSALGPRVYIPRARAVETGLLTQGSRARYEGYLKLPESADAEALEFRDRGRTGHRRGRLLAGRRGDRCDWRRGGRRGGAPEQGENRDCRPDDGSPSHARSTPSVSAWFRQTLGFDR